MLGKRERPSCEEETAARLTAVYDKIKKKYTEALTAIREETKTDPLDVVQAWCGQVIKLCASEFPNFAQKQLLDAIKDVYELQQP